MSDWPDSKMAERLDGIRKAVRSCTACPVHRECPQGGQVPPSGVPAKPVVFVGRNPGETEVEERRPFCGTTEGPITDLLRMTGFDRSSGYLTNTLKCFTNVPKRDRPPSREEVEFCSSRFLALEMRVIQPKLVVTLGADAFRWASKWQMVTCTGRTGQLFDFGDPWKVFCLYHPAHVARRPRLPSGEDIVARDLSDREALVVYMEQQGWLEKVVLEDIREDVVK